MRRRLLTAWLNLGDYAHRHNLWNRDQCSDSCDHTNDWAWPAPIDTLRYHIRRSRRSRRRRNRR